MKLLMLLKPTLLVVIIFFLGFSKCFAQGFQVGVSGGSGAMYAHEDYYSDFNYYNAIAFQTDFTFLDTNQLPKYGFSLYSNAADSWLEFNGREFPRGVVSNTGVMISKYFSKQLSNRFSGNLQVGTGLNLETTYYGTTQMMLNINLAAEVKYKVGKNWFIQAKGIAMAQDVPSIIRYYAFDVASESGEDLHLFYLIGFAVNVGK